MITNTEDLIDSRDIEERVEELEGTENKEEQKELASLARLMRQVEDYSDWAYGVTLVRDTYFLTYTKDLINDCCSGILGKNNDWPYRHITLDYKSAAEELKQDYNEVDFDGIIYYYI